MSTGGGAPPPETQFGPFRRRPRRVTLAARPMGGYILIVESDPVLQRRIGDTLKEAHYELASEAEGAWARRSIAVRAPDAVVVDTMLSDGDGFRLAEELRRDPDTRTTPIF